MKKNIIIIALSLLCALLIAKPAVHYIHHYGDKSKKAPVEPPKTVKPEEFNYTISVNSPEVKGYLLMDPSVAPDSVTPASNLVIMDMKGNTYVKKRIPSSAYDFKQWRINNRVFYSYGVRDTDARYFYFDSTWGKPRVPIMPAGHMVILDSALNEIKQVHLIPHKDISTMHNQDLDTHGMIVLSDNHFITLVRYVKRVKNIPDSLHLPSNLLVATCVLQESINGKVVWQWDASDHPEFYNKGYLNCSKELMAAHAKDTFVQDYIHPNSMLIDPKDDNLIISFRNLNQIIKINRKDGKIMWRLGGQNSDFHLAGQMKFLGQHGLTLEDNNRTLMFIDNGNCHIRPYSRILEFKLDEKNKTVAAFKSYKIPHLYIPSQGNVSKEGSNYLICGGVSKYVLLVNPATDEYLFEMMNNSAKTYCIHKVDSIYGLEKTMVKK